LFDVRNTVSKMGLISETFRRRAEVLRSLHPTHPILAQGKQAESIVAGHEECLYPCGPNSPFERLLKLDGKVLFFGVTEFHFTFHHYLEHLVSEDLPFPLYEKNAYVSEVIDNHGRLHSVKTYTFTKEAIRRRRVNVLFREMARRGQITRRKIGNTSVVLLKVADSVTCTMDLAHSGTYFYDLGKDA
jgi:aminoglycoside 3-N-acetyltransferase